MPGGTRPTITVENIDDDDIGGAWKGAFNSLLESTVPTSGTDPIYFDTTNRRFKRYVATPTPGWNPINPTAAQVFGSSASWLGLNNGITGSSLINSIREARIYLVANGYDTNKNYFFWNEVTETQDDHDPFHDRSNNESSVLKITNFSFEEDDTIEIVKGNLQNFYMRRAVTLSHGFDNLAEVKVRLARDNEEVIGSIVGYSYGKLQIAVEGWDVLFLNSTGSAIPVGSRIVGGESRARHSLYPWGYVKVAPEPTDGYSLTNANLRRMGRGMVMDSSITTAAGNLVRVAMKFGY